MLRFVPHQQLLLIALLVALLVAPSVSIAQEARIGPAQAAEHWSFGALTSPIPPTTKSTWSRTPIDAFILNRLGEAKLTPSPEADRQTLIRRATIDLTGLPPTPKQVDTFIANKSPDAYEKLIDRLLASPRYGERWGRHWLDLARYADSSGFHDDLDRPHAWRYRDYVIRSFNADKPFGQFIREQLAGDELPNATPETWIATGFCRNGPDNENNVKPAFREMYRLEQMDDVISTTSQVFLGITMGCARCHDHKTDPITQADYYSMLAVFNTGAKTDRKLTQDGKQFAGKGQKPKHTKNKKSKTPMVMAFTDSSTKPRPTHILLRGNDKTPAAKVGPAIPVVLNRFGRLKPVKLAPKAKTTGRRLALANWIAAENNPLTWRVLGNRLWQYHFGRGLVPTSDNFGFSGDRPSHPKLVDYLAQQILKHGGRLKPLHKQIMMSAVYRQASTPRPAAVVIDPDNRLHWRMSKKRVEAEVLRDSLLAVSGRLNLKMYGPGVKPRVPEEILRLSVRNKWPKVKTENSSHWRRSVYVYIKRQLQMPVMELFDAPVASASCSRRTASTIPTQALMMLNSQFTNELVAEIAKRIAATPSDDSTRARDAFRLILSRKHGPQDHLDAIVFLSHRLKAYRKQNIKLDDARLKALTDYCLVLINTNQFLYVD